MIGTKVRLSSTHTAVVGHGKFGYTIRVVENGLITPGQWYASTLAARTQPGSLAIDAGQGWTLTDHETALLRGFAVAVAAFEDSSADATVARYFDADGSQVASAALR